MHETHQEPYLVDDMLVDTGSGFIALAVTCKTLEEYKRIERPGPFYPKEQLTHPSRCWSGTMVEMVVSII